MIRFVFNYVKKINNNNFLIYFKKFHSGWGLNSNADV